MMSTLRFALVVALAVTCTASAQEWRVTEERLGELPPGAEWSALHPCCVWLGGSYFPFGLEPVPTALHAAAILKDADGRLRVWHDGVIDNARYTQITDLCFSPDGERMAYIGRRGGVRRMYVDGESGPGYAAIRMGPSFLGMFEPPSSNCCPNTPFSPDGGHFAYAAKTGRSDDAPWVVVLDGVPGPQFDLIDWDSAIFSPDGRRFAYVAVTLNEGAARPEGDDLLFWGWDNCKRRVIIDGEPGPDYAMVSDLQFSPDGRHFAYPGLFVR